MACAFILDFSHGCGDLKNIGRAYAIMSCCRKMIQIKCIRDAHLKNIWAQKLVTERESLWVAGEGKKLAFEDSKSQT